MNAHWRIMIAIGLLSILSCTGPAVDKRPAQSTDPVLDMLHQAIIELDASIEELNRHIADLQQMPRSPDPNIQELSALDLDGWQLHLQQWLLQRDHLQFAVTQIQQARANPQTKATAGNQWNARQQQFIKTFEELSSHRQQLERKRFDVESQVIGRYFR
ncbi:MAG TPA: hypothetical protein VJR03_14295 [Nitrospira sp.]|nr:hypothetical protein [Nitrospira sp.]